MPTRSRPWRGGARRGHDLAALWVREAPLYFAQWDEHYRPAVVAGAVGANAAPLIESNKIGFDLRGELNLVTAPTLIVSGRQDFVCGPPAARIWPTASKARR